MMLRQCVLAAALALLLAACHHRGSKQEADSTASNVQPKEAADTVKPAAPMTPDTVKAAPLRAAQRDTAEHTNLLIFARKQRTVYNPALLLGEWQRGSEREIYMADGSGRYWDASDDVEREEAQSFSWTMDSNLLTFTCRMRLGGVMVREYVVTFVDDETLVYCDAYGGSFMWDKVAAGFNDRPVAAR